MAGGSSQVMAVARYEWQIMLRNRWLAAFAILFALLGGFLFYWQNVIYNGAVGTGLSRQSNLLSNLVLQFVPLMSLILSAQSIAGEKSDGMVGLLRSYPLSSLRYLFGKWLGLSSALFLSLLVGLGIPILVGLFFSVSTLTQNIVLLLMGFFLIAIFSAIGLWVGGRVKGRMGAISASLALWFFLVFLYGMIVMLMVPYLPYLWKKPFLAVLLALNPIEGIRIGGVFIQGQGAVYGPEFVQWQRILQGWKGTGILLGLMFLYTILPLGFAVASLKKGGR